MRIVSIHLKNIKSHRDTELTFAPGINVLSGANGCGKSTVFQAIGYALFGVSAQDFVTRAERFLTIGSKRGEISVIFQPADGERYRVTRTVGPAAKWLLAKERDGGFEIEEHANIQETEQRIAALLGLAGGRPLADQFKLVIGPFQNDFLGPFVIRQPTRRQEAFDEILGIDAWRKTFEGTKTLTSAVQARMDTLQAEIEGKQDQVAVLPDKERELASLRQAQTEKSAQLQRQLAGLERITELVATLDAHKTRIDTVQHAVQEIEGRITSGREHIATQQLLVEQSKKAAAIVAESRAGKERYDLAEARLKELRAREQKKLACERKLAELEKEQSGLQAAEQVEGRELNELRDTLQVETSRLAEEERSLAEARQALDRQREQANAVLEAARDALSSFRELPLQRIGQTVPLLLSTLDALAAIDAASVERRAQPAGNAELQTLAEQLPERRAAIEQAQSKRAELSGRRLSLVEGREKIGAGDCPFFQEPCKNLQGGAAEDLFTARIEALDAEIAELAKRCVALAAQVETAQDASHQLAGLKQVAQELAKAEKDRARQVEEFLQVFGRIEPQLLHATLADWQGKAAMPEVSSSQPPAPQLPLAEEPALCKEGLLAWSAQWQQIIQLHDTALAANNSEAEVPVRDCAAQTATLAARVETVAAKKRELAANSQKMAQREQGIAARQKRLQALHEEWSALKAELEGMAGLEDAVKESSAELERSQPERDRYIANQKAAEELEKHQQTLTKYQAKLEELTAELSSRRGELQNLSAAYQPASHEAAKAEREQLLSGVATAKAELAAMADGVKRLAGEIALLTALAEEIKQKAAAIERLKEQGTLVKFLRNQVFKNVSTRLSERFREEISSRADRIYRCIADADEELVWGENYQVVLKDLEDGEVRERTDDQLSGGQMMSAVVSLRLALLQTIGARIAFFDEPTSNLDAERRENLAKAFRAIDVGQEEVTEHWYDQLFLVSHDVSFTEITDQTIQLD